MDFLVVGRNHWCLFAWFNPAHKKLSKLHAKKTTLLYMDSLHGMIDPFQCMPSLHRFNSQAENLFALACLFVLVSLHNKYVLVQSIASFVKDLH